MATRKKKAAARPASVRKKKVRKKRLTAPQTKINRITGLVPVIEELADGVANLRDKKALRQIPIFQATESLYEQLKRIHE
jgi:hypothetical protein